MLKNKKNHKENKYKRNKKQDLENMDVLLKRMDNSLIIHEKTSIIRKLW